MSEPRRADGGADYRGGLHPIQLTTGLSLLRKFGVEQREWDHRDASAAVEGEERDQLLRDRKFVSAAEELDLPQAASVHEPQRGQAFFHKIFELP